MTVCLSFWQELVRELTFADHKQDMAECRLFAPELAIHGEGRFRSDVISEVKLYDSYL